jgi:hypothetical protein
MNVGTVPCTEGLPDPAPTKSMRQTKCAITRNQHFSLFSPASICHKASSTGKSGIYVATRCYFQEVSPRKRIPKKRATVVLFDFKASLLCFDVKVSCARLNVAYR